MNTYILYHSRDLDGYTSGAIIKRKYPEGILIGYDYGKPFPEIPDNNNVIMVDVTIPVKDLLILSDRSNSVLVIDHHISFINELSQYTMPNNFMACLNDKKAACELAWEYFFGIEEDMPTSVQLLGQYDTWRNENAFNWKQRVLPFQYGMRLICTSAESFPKELFSDKGPDGLWPIQDIINKGTTVVQYQSMVDERAMKGAFEFEWRGYKILACNAGGINSNAFSSVLDPAKHDIMMPFFYNGKVWNFSLYTTKDDIDCSILAKQMGGGGHKKAAGFQVSSVEELPFILV